jgi:hypothetical protein
MAINSEVIKSTSAKKDYYPCLMKVVNCSAKENPLVVLFSGFSKGTVLIPNESYKVGTYSDSWSNNLFEETSDSVTLSNL